ncbi:ribonuclease H-like domain-containing protein [Suillus clintonianus]|uniref:ribonuclease H-like domain-containing protein n=1 Tax=Suillus clintonianus TaxID=1904413 RepID=UPI001B870DD0|nr:ribonuclease H-like domain-containing protein [Suillus clintonianus]KAG2129585.1 ribonuclease H-like domain-containing protein [Suillus clintonianus]
MNTNSNPNRIRTLSRGIRGRGGVQRGTVAQRGPAAGPARSTYGPPARPQQAGAPQGGEVDELLRSHEQALDKRRREVGIRYERPIRPGFGTLGDPVTLTANFFALKITNSLVNTYHVKVEPARNAKDVQRRLLRLLEETDDQPWQSVKSFVAFDGRETLVSAKELPQPMQISVSFFEEGETPSPNSPEYTVSFQLLRKWEMSELNKYLHCDADVDISPLISAYNIVIQQHASSTATRVGNSRYFGFPDYKANELSPGLTGLQALRGFFLSVRPVFGELMVNVGVCMTPFYKPIGRLDLAYNESADRSKGAIPQRFAQNVKVTTTYLGYTKRRTLLRITSSSAEKTTFLKDGRQISVAQHFQEAHDIALKRPDLPLADLGTERRAVYVPLELCTIESQPFRGLLDDRETTKMLNHACQPPAANFEEIIKRGLPSLALTKPKASLLDKFGISISQTMTDIPGRELPPPKSLLYRSSSLAIQPAKGSWNLANVKFHTGASVAKWAVVVVGTSRDEDVSKVWKGFKEGCQNSGMMFDESPPTIARTSQLPRQSQDRDRSKDIKEIKQTIQDISRDNPTFVLVLLPFRDTKLYPGVKRICDVELGIHSVTIVLDKILKSKGPQQYYANIALKLNQKLGGINHTLDAKSTRWLTTKSTMLVGMDVTHPGPASKAGTPSIAAVVATIDETFVQCPVSLRCQKSKQEMIDDLTEMMLERLRAYKKTSGSLPERVIVYRDGVSEGQFDTVLERGSEKDKILDAFKAIQKETEGLAEYRPHLSIIICGKRHHARTRPTNSKNESRNGNTRPGTVFDRRITAVFDFDFYLQAHDGLKGHVRPTHYTVVYDENGFSANDIQQGTHTASYLYARATKAVSLVPLAYYADLACERARCYLEGFLNSEQPPASGSSSKKGGGKGKGKGVAKEAADEREAAKQRVYDAALQAWGNGVHANLKEMMFYI